MLAHNGRNNWWMNINFPFEFMGGNVFIQLLYAPFQNFNILSRLLKKYGNLLLFLASKVVENWIVQTSEVIFSRRRALHLSGPSNLDVCVWIFNISSWAKNVLWHWIKYCELLQIELL